MVWTCAHTLCNNDGPSLGWIMGGGVSIYIYIYIHFFFQIHKDISTKHGEIQIALGVNSTVAF